jgi:hypothetical protein
MNRPPEIDTCGFVLHMTDCDGQVNNTSGSSELELAHFPLQKREAEQLSARPKSSDGQSYGEFIAI